MDHAQRSKPAASRAIAGFLAAASTICSLSGNSIAQCQYEVTAIIQAPECPIIGHPVTLGTAISAHGVVVGDYADCQGEGDHAFVWTGRQGMIDLILPPEVFSANPRAINDSNLIVGRANATGNDLNSVGFVYDDGKTFLLNHDVLPPETSTSELNGVNNLGDVVGFFAGSELVGGDSHAVLVQGEIIVDIHRDLDTTTSLAFDINDYGQVTGWRYIDESSIDAIAFIWEDGEFISLGSIPGGFTSEGRAINDLGHVTGRGQLPPELPVIRHAFLWRDGVMIDLGTIPCCDETSARDINNKDVVVGVASDPGTSGFVWAAGVMSDLNELIDPKLDISIEVAYSINESGQITAKAGTPDGTATVVLTPIGASAGDLNGNCEVNFQDLLILLGDWGSASPLSDIDSSGSVGFSDLLILLDEWG